jgi:hypothetical protein
VSDQNVTLTIGANADGVEQTINQVKAVLSNASEAAKSLSAMIGNNLSDSVRQTTSTVQVLGESVEAAFNPLEIISFVQAVSSAATSLSALISDLFIYTQAEKNAYAQEVGVNSQILKMVEHTKQLRRERELLEAPDQKAKNALKLKFLIEDQHGTSADFSKQMKAKMDELQAARRKMVTVGFGDAATGMQTQMQVLYSDTQEGEEEIRKLNEVIGILKAKMDEASESEQLLARQNQNALAVDAVQRHLADVIKSLNQVQVIEVQTQKNRINTTQLGSQQVVADYEKSFTEINAATQQFNNQQLSILMTGINKNSNQIVQASQNAFKKIEQSEAASLSRRQKLWDQTFKGISGAFDTFINGLLSGQQKLSQAWEKLVESMVSKFVDGLEKQLMSFIEHKLMELTIHTSTEQAKDVASKAAHAKEDERTAYSAAKGAWESVVHTPIVGPILAPIAAATTFAAVSAFGSAEGGQYIVPSEQLTMLHRNEMVLPAGVADRMRGVIEGGGGGGGTTVVVNHSVSAVDAESFQSHIRRHANLIGNEVARVLKKKSS